MIYRFFAMCLAWACLVVSAKATVLTFDFGGSNGVTVPSNYGSRVGDPWTFQPPEFSYGSAGGLTPNVSVTYDQPMRLGGAANPVDPTRVFGDLTNVLYRDRNAASNPGVLQIILWADPGYQVTLSSFDLAAVYNSVTGAGEDIPARSISVSDGAGNALYALNFDPSITDHDSLLSTYIPGTLPLRHKHFSWDAAPLQASTLVIRVDFTQFVTLGGSKFDRLGIDNITFGQVPAAGSATLIGLAGVLLISRRTRAGEGRRSRNDEGVTCRSCSDETTLAL